MPQSNQSSQKLITPKNLIIIGVILILLILGVAIFAVYRYSHTDRYFDQQTELRYFLNDEDRINKQRGLSGEDLNDYTANELYLPLIEFKDKIDAVNCNQVTGSESECSEVKSILKNISEPMQDWVDIYNKYSLEEVQNGDISNSDKEKLGNAVEQMDDIEREIDQLKSIIN